MSRELKFRNWKNGFSFLNLLEDNDNDFYEFYRYGDDIIEQYTGLKDKNGKEIYEGDIVKVYYKRKLEGTYQLVWDDLNAIYELSKTNDYNDADYVFGGANYSYCVIGNIHENPELLGG